MAEGENNGAAPPVGVKAIPAPNHLASITIELQPDGSCQVKWSGKFPNYLLLLGMLDFGRDEVKKVLAESNKSLIIPP